MPITMIASSVPNAPAAANGMTALARTGFFLTVSCVVWVVVAVGRFVDGRGLSDEDGGGREVGGTVIGAVVGGRLVVVTAVVAATLFFPPLFLFLDVGRGSLALVDAGMHFA